MAMVFQIKRPFLAQLLAHLQSEYPLEACGILAGQMGRVVKIYPIGNILQSRTAYEMNPKQQLAAMLEIEDRSWEMLAIYHSHPNGPETPSPTDIAQAYYPDTIQLIVSLRQRERPSIRAFTIVDGRVEEVEINVQP
ncbi:MAG: M67 family metallopeptidase [Chloroflexi bacterium]|nr:M67 family metallopeptidase [Chloroflexota bacterium]